jgi:hypothetical protein
MDYELTQEQLDAIVDAAVKNALTDAGFAEVLRDTRSLGYADAAKIAVTFAKEFAPGFARTLDERLFPKG